MKYRYAVLNDDSSCGHWWKWNSYLFQWAFFWEVIISSCFWGFIVPSGDSMAYTGTPNKIINESLDHSMPLILLTTDWCLNGIGFEYAQILTNILVTMVYGLINYLYVTLKGETIYPVLTWDSVTADLLALALIPIICLLNFLLVLCTNYKISKINKALWENDTQVVDDDIAAVLMNYD